MLTFRGVSRVGFIHALEPARGATEIGDDRGPVMVTMEWRIDPENSNEFRVSENRRFRRFGAGVQEVEIAPFVRLGHVPGV